MIRTTACGTMVLLVLMGVAYGQQPSNAKGGSIRLSIGDATQSVGEPFEVMIETRNAQDRPVKQTLILTVSEVTEQSSRVVRQGEIPTREADGLARAKLVLDRTGSYVIQGSLKTDPTIKSKPITLQIVGTRIFDDRVDRVLRDWADRAKEIKSLWAEFDRTVKDTVWQNEEVNEGCVACYLAPNQARLDIPNVESFIVTGKGEIWEFKPPQKQIKIFELPPEMMEKQNLQEDGPLPFLFGTDPEEAKARYQFKIGEENEKVIHLIIIPKLQQDQQNFARAEIWLNKKTYLPDKLTFQEPNRNVISFRFTGIWVNVPIDPDNYFKPKTFEDWRVIRQKVATQPSAMQRR